MFGTWISWIAKTFDYINRITKRLHFGLRGHMDTLSPLVAMHLLDRSCMIVGIFLNYYVPQEALPPWRRSLGGDVHISRSYCCFSSRSRFCSTLALGPLPGLLLLLLLLLLTLLLSLLLLLAMLL